MTGIRTGQRKREHRIPGPYAPSEANMIFTRLVLSGAQLLLPERSLR
ncbi:MAG TPA: hypothetical protein VF086_10060 [Propionibacteriaceae bacterium]